MRLLFILIIMLTISIPSVLLHPTDWPTLLKRGTLTVKPDVSYAKGVNWEDYLLDFRRDLCLDPGNNLFMADAYNHHIYKFSPDGKLLKTFGQKGQGPGDFVNPSDIGLFSGKFLLVGEYATNRRMSVFDRNGAFIRMIRTKSAVFSPTPVNDNVVAYYYFTYALEDRKGAANPHKKGFNRAHIVLKDLKTEKEKEVTSLDVSNSDQLMIGNHYMFSLGYSYKGSAHLKGDSKGNLYVGHSGAPDIRIYSPKGDLLKTFKLNIPPIKVTADYISKHREAEIRSFRENPSSKKSPMYKEILNKLESHPFESFFAEYYPYYHMILNGPDGGLIFVLFGNPSEGKRFIEFQSYSPMGDFQGQFRLDTGDYGISTDPRFIHLAFGNEAMCAICSTPEDEEELKLIKILY